MFSAVINFGSNLIYGQSEESERIPKTDENLRRGSLGEKVDENWVIIGEVRNITFSLLIFTYYIILLLLIYIYSVKGENCPYR